MTVNRRPTYSPKADLLLLKQIERTAQDEPETLQWLRERRAMVPRLTELHRQRGTLAGEGRPPTIGETMDLFGGELGASTVFGQLADLISALDASAKNKQRPGRKP